MATIILQAAGAFLGGVLGSAGVAIGQAAGALAGYAIDRALIQGTRRIEGPRLASARPFTAEEGSAVPRIYGAARIGGTLIWATRFEEDRSTERQGARAGRRSPAIPISPMQRLHCAKAGSRGSAASGRTGANSTWRGSSCACMRARRINCPIR